MSGGLVSGATLSAGAIVEEVAPLISGAGTTLSLAAIPSTVTGFNVPASGASSDVVSAIGATVVAGGAIDVSVGGSTVSTTLNSGGTEVVFAGALFNSVFGVGSGTASGTVVNSGGVEILSGGTASGTIVSSGGTEVVSAGGLSSSATINSGGVEAVLAEQLEFIAPGVGFITAAGRTRPVSGATSSAGAIVEEVGLLVSGAGTTLSLAPITSTVSNFNVMSAGAFSDVVSAVGATVVSGGVIDVSSGGATLDTTVSSGGTEFVFAGRPGERDDDQQRHRDRVFRRHRQRHDDQRGHAGTGEPRIGRHRRHHLRGQQRRAEDRRHAEHVWQHDRRFRGRRRDRPGGPHILLRPHVGDPQRHDLDCYQRHDDRHADF